MILNNEVDKDILLIITEQALSIINGYIQFLFRVTKLIRNTIVSKEHNNDVHVNMYNVNRQCFNCKIKKRLYNIHEHCNPHPIRKTFSYIGMSILYICYKYCIQNFST